MPSCLVDKKGDVYAKDGVFSHSKIARAFGLNVVDCLKYGFLLAARGSVLVTDFSIERVPFTIKRFHDLAAEKFFDECVSTPEKLIAFVQRGNFQEEMLRGLLAPSAWGAYGRVRTRALEEFDKAASIAWGEYEKNVGVPAMRRKYERAKASARRRHNKAMGSFWAKLFENPCNRIEAWKK